MNQKCLPKSLNKTAIELIEYSGGLHDSSTEIMARDIIGTVGLIEYLADCLDRYENKQADEDAQ